MPSNYDVTLINDIVQKEWGEPDNKPTATGSRLRISNAGKCSRAIAFDAMGVEPAHPITGDTMMAFEVGNDVHALIQRAVLKHLPNAALEVVCTYEPAISVSGSADFTYTLEMETPEGEAYETLVVGEIKSLSGYGWKIAVGQVKSDESGPKIEHVLQAALYAGALDAEYIHMVYWDKDKGGIAEWLIDVTEEFLDTGLSPAFMVDRELDRWAGIIDKLDKGTLPARFIPSVGLIDRPPANGKQGGKPWQCVYCSHRDTCAREETGDVPKFFKITNKKGK